MGKTPAELDVELYRRILMNTAYLFKSKGTRKSIEFLLSLLGIMGGLANLWLTQSYKLSDVSLVTPLKYLALVLQFYLDILFGEKMKQKLLF